MPSIRDAARRSPFAALIRNEWRLQWRVWRSLAVPLVFVIVVIPVLFFRAPEPLQSALSSIMGPLLLFLGASLILVLGANSFAGNRNEAVENSLHVKPFSRSKLFWGKLASCFALVFPILLVFCAALAWRVSRKAMGLDETFNEYIGYSDGPSLDIESSVIALAILCLATILLLSATAIVASCGGGVVMTVVGSAVVGALLLYWTFTTAYYCVQTVIRWSVPWFNIGFVLVPVFVLNLAVMALGAWRCWVGAVRRLGARAARLLLTAVAIVAIPCIPTATICLWVIYVATPADYLRYGQHVDIEPSAGGRFITMHCESSGHSIPDPGANDGRIAIVDVDSGGWRWVDRAHESSHPSVSGWGVYSQLAWSPDGSRCFLFKSAVVAMPNSILFRCGRGNTLMFDARTQALRRMEGSPYGEYAGWLDNATLYSGGVPDHFLHIDTGEVSVCPSPAEFSRFSHGPHAGTVVLAERGVYFWTTYFMPPDKTPLIYIGRYHPDLAVAEQRTLAHKWLEPKVDDISPDGRLALLHGWSEVAVGGNGYEKIGSVFYVASLENGFVTEILPPKDMPRLQPWGPLIALFLHDSRRFAIPMPHQLSIYDIASKQWMIYGAPETPYLHKGGWTWPVLSPDRRYVVLATPAEDRLVTIDLDTGAERSIWFSNARFLSPV